MIGEQRGLGGEDRTGEGLPDERGHRVADLADDVRGAPAEDEAIGEGAGTGGRTIRMGVTVRTWWASREVQPAEVVDREQRRELARAVGVDPSVVTRVLKGGR